LTTKGYFYEKHLPKAGTNKRADERFRASGVKVIGHKVSNQIASDQTNSALISGTDAD